VEYVYLIFRECLSRKWAKLRKLPTGIEESEKHKSGDGTSQEPRWAFFTLLLFLDVQLKSRE
jgi:hypothetical protein